MFVGFLAASSLMSTVSPARAQDDTATSTEVEITEKARNHFRAGVAFLQDPDGARYAEAYREFKAAYAESPSWKILGNLGICSMKLERDGEAIEAFDKYLVESGDALDPAERAQVERDLATLKAGVVWITLKATVVGGSLTDQRIPLAGNPRINRYGVLSEELRFGVHPGRHVFTLELDGYESASWTIDASSGSSHEHTFELVKKEAPQQPVAPTQAPPAMVLPAPAPERPVPTGVWIGVAATGALALGGTVVGIMAVGKESDYEPANREGYATSEERKAAEELKNEGETLNLVADGLFAGALVAGGLTAYFFFTRPDVTPEQDTALRVAPTALPGGGGLWMQGRF